MHSIRALVLRLAARIPGADIAAYTENRSYWARRSHRPQPGRSSKTAPERSATTWAAFLHSLDESPSGVTASSWDEFTDSVVKFV